MYCGRGVLCDCEHKHMHIHKITVIKMNHFMCDVHWYLQGWWKLMKCFLHLFHYFFLGTPSSVHFCFFVELPSLLACVRTSPTHFYSFPRTHALEPHLSIAIYIERGNARARAENVFQQIRKMFDYIVLSRFSWSRITHATGRCKNHREYLCRFCGRPV